MDLLRIIELVAVILSIAGAVWQIKVAVATLKVEIAGLNKAITKLDLEVDKVIAAQHSINIRLTRLETEYHAHVEKPNA